MHKSRILKLLCKFTNHLWIYDYDLFEHNRYCKNCGHKQRRKKEHEHSYWHHTHDDLWEDS